MNGISALIKESPERSLTPFFLPCEATGKVCDSEEGLQLTKLAPCPFRFTKPSVWEIVSSFQINSPTNWMKVFTSLFQKVKMRIYVLKANRRFLTGGVG